MGEEIAHVEAQPVEAAADMVPVQPGTLVGTNDPDIAIERLTKTADALKRVVDDKGLISRISGKEYPRVEAWQTLGVLLGVTSIVDWTRPVVVDDQQIGWEARVEARTLDGRVIGAGEAMCTRRERKWSRSDDYAIRSMAQTRATSKAMRGPLGFVMQLAGYEATPAEEMDTKAQKVGAEQPEIPKRPVGKAKDPEPTVAVLTGAQRRLLFKTGRDNGLDEAQLRAVFQYVGGSEHSDRIPRDRMDLLLEALGRGETFLAQLGQAASGGDERAQQVVAKFLTVAEHQEGQ